MNNFIEYYKNKNILIVGAGGHIGSSLARKLSEINCNLTLLYHNKPGYRPENSQVLVADIASSGIWEDLIANIDIIFYLAAHESNNFEPLLDAQVNCLSLLNLLETCKIKKVFPKIIFASSSNLAGIVKKLPVDESFKDNPLTIYAIHKLTAEKYLDLYAREFGLPSLTLRLANVYGPGETLDLSLRSTLNKMVNNAVLGKALKLFANKDKIRDFLFISDAVQAFLAAGGLKSALGQTYVIGSEVGFTFTKIVEEISKLVSGVTGKNSEVIEDMETSIKQVEMRDFVADSAKFKNESLWKPEVGLKDGLEKTINYFYKQTNG